MNESWIADGEEVTPVQLRRRLREGWLSKATVVKGRPAAPLSNIPESTMYASEVITRHYKYLRMLVSSVYGVVRPRRSTLVQRDENGCAKYVDSDTIGLHSWSSTNICARR